MQAFRGVCSNCADIHVRFLNTALDLRFPMAVTVKSTVSWDVTSCSLVKICQRSGGICFILQDGDSRLLRKAEKFYQTTRHHIPKVCFSSLRMAVPWLGRLMGDLSPRTPDLNPMPVRVEFVLDKVVLGLGFFLNISVCRVRIIPLMPHTHSSNTDAIEL
jgi:hypothetical protein